MSHRDGLCDTYRTLCERLLAARNDERVWIGELSSSALSTATAVIALATAGRTQADRGLVERGLQWLAHHQNDDGGWGDTTQSASNISTTALCWAAFAFAASPPQTAPAVRRCEAWLSRAAGGLTPADLQKAIAARYGKDRTFSAPILTTLALAGRLGADGWRFVPQLPFELAACPQRWFQFFQLPVVSYALPALIAIGQARHHRRPSRNPVLRELRRRCESPTLRVLRQIQPQTGGYLEATPLTSFVVMSLAAIDQHESDVAREGLKFLRASIRTDGSWPIDTNLSTWVTTLSINALASGSNFARHLTEDDRLRLTTWLLETQHRQVHAYTGAAPGGWAWTPLPGGVPDADDTAGALVALKQLGVKQPHVIEAARVGVEWLLGLQNRDGGMPTFCRGWGTLPFDRSAPDLTAHALTAWAAWGPDLSAPVSWRIARAIERAFAYLRSTQREDGGWNPLWFGNEHVSGDVNVTYGTAKVVSALARLQAGSAMVRRGRAWLLAAQNSDGGWGGAAGVPSSIEETSFAVEALASGAAGDASDAIARGVRWLIQHTSAGQETPPSPIGLYFASLWYYETLYPIIFATTALGRVRANA